MSINLITKVLSNKVRYEWRMLVSLLKYGFVKKTFVEDLSKKMPSISIETTNICNADCVFCAYQYQTRQTGVMSEELFKKIIDEYDEIGGGHVSFTPTVGDPLVDPHLLERIRYSKSKRNVKSIGTYSNLILLDKFTAEGLVGSGLDSMTVSISGFDEEMYKRVYRSDLYKKVFRNLTDLIEANKQHGEPIDIQIDMRVDRPLREVFASEDLKQIADLIGPEHLSVKFQYDNWAGKIGDSDLLSNMKLRKHSFIHRPRISPCVEMYSGPMIYWDGKVGACGCRDVDASELIIGDVNKESLSEIWFGEEIIKLRDEFLTPKIKPICKECTHYNNLSQFLQKS